MSMERSFLSFLDSTKFTPMKPVKGTRNNVASTSQFSELGQMKKARQGPRPHPHLRRHHGDGRADKFTFFAQQVRIPTSIAFARGGVLRQPPSQHLDADRQPLLRAGPRLGAGLTLYPIADRHLCFI
jgi:hypothetical protein